MDISYEKYGFYTIDIDYVKYLHSKDTEVFYSREMGYGKKPYLGLIANLNGFTYCIHIKVKSIKSSAELIFRAGYYFGFLYSSGSGCD
jgi:hypothetical protein